MTENETNKPFEVLDEVWFIIDEQARITADHINTQADTRQLNTRLRQGIVKRIIRNGNDWALGIIVDGNDSYEQIICESFCAHKPNLLIGKINSAIARARVDLYDLKNILARIKIDYPDIDSEMPLMEASGDGIENE